MASRLRLRHLREFDTRVLLFVARGRSLGLGGCAAIGLTGAALGASALSAGAGIAVHAGTEFTSGGTVYRTFSLSLPDLRARPE